MSLILSHRPRHSRRMFTATRRLPQKPPPPPTGRVERVCLVQSPHLYRRELEPFWGLAGTIEGMVGDEVLVRFGELVVQVPAEMLVEQEG